MKLHQLEYYLGVLDAGSLSKVSVNPGVAQPSLGKHLASLEAAAYPVVMPPKQTLNRRHLDEAAETAGLALNIRQEQMSLQLLGLVIGNGEEFAIAPISGHLNQIKSGQYFARPIVRPEIGWPIDIYWPNEKPETQQIADVRNLPRKTIVDLVDDGSLVVEFANKEPK